VRRLRQWRGGKRPSAGMLSNVQRCWPTDDGPTRQRTQMDPPPPRPSLAQSPCPTPQPQVGIGPDARPKRKKPNLVGWAKRLYYQEFSVAPRPGLEPGTYGLTVELTAISMAAKLKIRNAFFLRIRPVVSDRAYPEPWHSVGCFLGAKTRTKSRKSPHFLPTGNRTDMGASAGLGPPRVSGPGQNPGLWVVRVVLEGGGDRGVAIGPRRAQVAPRRG